MLSSYSNLPKPFLALGGTPCPARLSCIISHVPDFLRELLLLGGDIETNPGPDIAQISNRLKDVAVDIKDIKEKRLVNIEKVDALWGLEEKLASYQEQVASMSGLIQVLEKRIDEMENHSRR